MICICFKLRKEKSDFLGLEDIEVKKKNVRLVIGWEFGFW